MTKPDRPVSGFVPIGDVVAGVELPDGPALTPAAPQARHHFTTLRQVDQLIEASEADADLGFMARLLALCSLPRTNPKNRLQYVRCNGPYTLTMTASSAGVKLPFGTLPRLLLAWVCSEAVRTQRRDLVLGRSLYEFMHKLGLDDQGGGERGNRVRLKNQMERLFSCSVSLVYADAGHKVQVYSFIADRAEYWWDVSRPNAPVLWNSTIELGEKFFQEIIAHPIPIDMNTLRAFEASSLGLDLYLWLTYRTFTLRVPIHSHVAAALPPVRRRPREGGKERLGQPLPRGGLARAEKNQARVAGPALSHGHGRARPLAIAAAHPTGTAPSHRRLGQRGAYSPRGWPVRGVRPHGGSLKHQAAWSLFLRPLSAATVVFHKILLF